MVSQMLSSTFDRDALDQFVTEHFDRVVQQARRNLQGFPQTAFNAEDVAVSAFRSLLKHVAVDDDGELLDRSELVRLLYCIARNKAVNAMRNEVAIKRGGRRRGSGDPDLLEGGGDGPEHVVIMHDLSGTLLKRLGKETREVAEFKLKGYSNQEVADKLNVAVRTVERRLEKIREACAIIFT